MDFRISEARTWLQSHPLAVLFIFYLIAKSILYRKFSLDYLEFYHTENDFFPEFLFLLNPLAIDLCLIVLFVIGTRWSFGIAAVLSLMLVVHPIGFGTQHYVMSSYMFIWLALKDEQHSVLFGRITLSFLYMAATIGKLTPGWISGAHFKTFLPHLQQDPYLILLGEFAFGIAFLLPFYIGVVMPIIIIIGMLFSISYMILDAVGPILGMLLTFLILGDPKRDTIKNLKAPSSFSGYARGVCVGVYALYLTMALAIPKTVYVERYLLAMPYRQWILFQVFPSMYTTEIFISRATEAEEVFATPHHPARIFFLFKDAQHCDAYTITVKYQDNVGSRGYELCNGQLKMDEVQLN